MTTEGTDPPSLGDLFIETHISKATNDALDDVSREYIAQMQHEAGFDENGKKKSIPNEIYWKLMPPKRNGLVRMMGPLGTKTKVFGSRSSNGENTTRIQGLEAQLFNMTTEMSNLKRKLEEKDQDAERRLKEREDAIERRMLLKLKAMMGILSPNNDLDGMELDLNLDLNVASAGEEWSGCT